MGEEAFGSAFGEALERRGVSLAWLHQRLVDRGHPVSPAALSYWRSGRSQPERGTSRDALVEIERLLHVDPGSLTSRLGPSRRPGPRPAERTLRELFAETPGLEDALHALGFIGLYDEVVETIRHVTVDVDADGRTGAMQVRAALRARHDDARRTPLIMTMDESGQMAQFVPIAGCSLGRQVIDVQSRVYATELLLDHPMAKDETALYELAVDLPEPIKDTHIDQYVVRRVSELLVWVRFDPAHRPAHVERYTQVGDHETVERLDLGGGCGAHAMARGFGPGMLGVRWSW
ncbi:MAG: hypothetical protein J2P22_10345 [Nocardioides sp.]|nr:hypothetical protein [Nocardioides sp.]